MNIGELAQRTGVSRDALRLYERRGLLEAARRANGYRDFDADAVRQVELIRLGQRLGFSLREIGEIAAAMRGGGLDKGRTETLLRGKMAEVRARIADLQALNGLLEGALQQVCPLQTPTPG